MQQGLRPWVKDERDIHLGALFTPPKDRPTRYIVPFFANYEAKDQKDTDFCSAFATTSAMEATERVTLSPEFFFACSKTLSLDPEAWGQTLTMAGQTAVKIGAIEAFGAPLTLDSTSPDTLRQISSWGDLAPLFDRAIVHKQSTFATCKGSKDAFDNICDWIYKFERPVVMGMEWGTPKEVQTIDAVMPGFGHAVVIVGFDGEYVTLLNSWGKDAGDKGFFRVHRRVVNVSAPRFGAIMFTDISIEEAKRYMERGAKLDESIIIALLRIAGEKLKQLYTMLLKPNQEKLEKMAYAIREFEGWAYPGGKDRTGKVHPQGSLSYRNHNPGNVRWSKYQEGKRGGYSYFKDYETGWKALLFQIEIAYNGKSQVYKPTDTLLTFFEKYAPSEDHNHPEEYAKFVAKALGVGLDVPLSVILK